MVFMKSHFFYMHIFKMGKTIKEEEEKRKSQIVSLSWNLVPRLIRICRIYLCSHFLFSTGNTLLGQIWSKKNQNCQFKPKLCTKSNSNMQNAIVIFIFFFFFRFFFCFFCFFVCLFETGNILFRQIWSKKSKLSV